MNKNKRRKTTAKIYRELMSKCPFKVGDDVEFKKSKLAKHTSFTFKVKEINIFDPETVENMLHNKNDVFLITIEMSLNANWLKKVD